MYTARIISILLSMLLITSVLLFSVTAAASKPDGHVSGAGALSIETPADETALQISDTNSSKTLNISSRHIGPELTQNESSASIIISEVEARIGSRLLNSSEAIQAGQFDTAETEISGNTSDLLRQYNQIAAQTESSTDDEVAQELNLTVQQQRDLINNSQNISVLYNEYQLAQANGNQTRANQLSRRLTEQIEGANQTAEQLSERYQVTGNETEIDADQIIDDIDQGQTRVAEVKAEIQSETEVDTIVPTSLDVSSSAVASPTQPLRITGTLSSEGSGLANKNIQISLGDTTIQTKTNEAGDFRSSVRPIMIASGRQTLSVQFTPEPTSVYDEQRVEKDVRVDSVTPDTDIQYSPSQVQFRDTVVVEGKVAADETSLSGVPVATTIAGQQFGSTRTDDDGDFRIRGSLPATIASGSQQIEVIISDQNMAVQENIKTNEIYVNSTGTELLFTSIQTNGSNIEFTGQLTTANGFELSDRNIVISQGDNDSVGAYTNQSGYFEGSLSIQSTNSIAYLPFVSGERTVTAQYESVGGNLKSSTQNTVVSYTPPISVPLQQIAIVGLGLAIILLAIILWRRREIQSNEAEDTLQKIADSETTLPPHSAVNISPDRLLSHAEKQYTEGNIGAAARLSYAALRQQYMEAYDVTGSLTHWELYQTLRPELNSPTQELLYEATAVYEQELYSDVDFSAHDELGIVLEQLGEVIGSDESAITNLS
jgi:hypothetical protein